MVGYKLIDIDDEGRLFYEYAIEASYDSDGTLRYFKGEDSLGLAALDPETGKAQIVKRAPKSFDWHEPHLLMGLQREFREKGVPPQAGCFAWY